jgi:hypothetical protein
MKHPFQVGETYENEKGEYEVESIEGSTMQIRWADGSTWEGSIALQARILERIQLEREARMIRRERAQRRAASRADSRGRSFAGLVDGDFQTGIVGTSWRRRESLGGLLASRLSKAASREFQSYTVYRQPVVHIASLKASDTETRRRLPKFFFRLDEARASYGFFIEKPDEPMDDSWHWPKFLVALEGGSELCQLVEAAMAEFSLDWRVWLQPEPGLIARVKLSENKLVWTPVPEGDVEEMTWQAFVGRLREIPEDQWCDLSLATSLAKGAALSAGVGVADRAVEVFGALFPLYEASPE